MRVCDYIYRRGPEDQYFLYGILLFNFLRSFDVEHVWKIKRYMKITILLDLKWVFPAVSYCILYMSDYTYILYTCYACVWWWDHYWTVSSTQSLLQSVDLSLSVLNGENCEKHNKSMNSSIQIFKLICYLKIQKKLHSLLTISEAFEDVHHLKRNIVFINVKTFPSLCYFTATSQQRSYFIVMLWPCYIYL